MRLARSPGRHDRLPRARCTVNRHYHVLTTAPRVGEQTRPIAACRSSVEAKRRAKRAARQQHAVTVVLRHGHDGAIAAYRDDGSRI